MPHESDNGHLASVRKPEGQRRQVSFRPQNPGTRGYHSLPQGTRRTFLKLLEADFKSVKNEHALLCVFRGKFVAGLKVDLSASIVAPLRFPAPLPAASAPHAASRNRPIGRLARHFFSAVSLLRRHSFPIDPQHPPQTPAASFWRLYRARAPTLVCSLHLARSGIFKTSCTGRKPRLGGNASRCTA